MDEGFKLDDEACYRALSARDPRFDGRFFVAVRTTGIYCRPICPARTPMRKNVTFYPSAAAAQEAGYRPCLRCRPETSPQIGAWRGTSNTVSRALALIEAGGLDEADVASLAERVGVGERQLRRLFAQHLGASPGAVAATRRVLLAKQLIHDTNLPMAQVALAAGFNSVRRFNDIFLRLYRRPPSALRRARRFGDASAIALTLAYKPPYDWDSIIRFLAARAIPGVEIVAPDLYRRAIAFDGKTGSIEVRHEPARNQLRVSVRFPSVAALPSIIARVRRVFDLGADPAAIGEQLGADPHLARLVAKRPGLRVPGGWDGFEQSVRGIVGQQITVFGARLILGKLTARYGECADGGNGLTHIFPSPTRMAEADPTTFGMPRARGMTIVTAARAAMTTPDLFERAASLEAGIERLRGLKGIGEWTAHYIALRALREPDAFPHGDVALHRALAEDGVRPTPKELLARAEAWRPWRAYAAQHLWTEDADRAPRSSAELPLEGEGKKRMDHGFAAPEIAVADRNDPARL